MKRTRHIFNNKYIIFYKMVTNTITIVAIIVMSLSIVSTSVVFGESQEYIQITRRCNIRRYTTNTIVTMSKMKIMTNT